MQLFFQAGIAGLAEGILFAIAAVGLVLTYTTSGIFNFSHGAVAMFAAFSYYQCTEVWNWPVWLSLPLVIFVGIPLLQLGIYVLIFRRLHATSEVTKLVVSISVMLFLFQLATWLWPPGNGVSRTLPYFWGPTSVITIGGVNVTYHLLFTAFVAAVIGVVLWVWFKRSRTGVAMRAVVDSPDLLELNGARPQRLSALSWAVSGALAAVAGIMIVPLQGGSLDQQSLTLLLVSGGITAAMIGRLRSIPMTIVGGLIIGLEVSYWSFYAPNEWSNWSTQFSQIIPAITLFVVLLVLPQDRLRGATPQRVRERFKAPTLASSLVSSLVMLLVVAAIGALMVDTDKLTFASGIGVGVIALSLVLLTGYSGQINLAPMSFAAIGAMVAYHHGVYGSILAQHLSLLGVLYGVIITAVIGGIVALPALRLRGLYLGLATVAFAVFIDDFVAGQINDVLFNFFGLFKMHLSFFPGGAINYPPMIEIIPPIHLFGVEFGWTLSTTSPFAFLMAYALTFVVVALGIGLLRRSTYGRRLVAMKDSPVAAATLGQSLFRLKISVFMISAGLAGFGGILYAEAAQNIQPNQFSLLFSLLLAMLCVVQGIGSISGSIQAGVMFAVGFTAISTTLLNLAGGPSIQAQGVFTWTTLWHLSTLLPAMTGIFIGGNPSGATSNFITNYQLLWKTQVLLWTIVGLEIVNWAFAYCGIWGNWWFVLVTGILGVLAPALNRLQLQQRARAVSGADLDTALVGASL